MTPASPKQLNYIKQLEARIGVENAPEVDTWDDAHTLIEELLEIAPAVPQSLRKMYRLARDHGGIFQPCIGKTLNQKKTSTLIATMEALKPTKEMLQRLNDLRATQELPPITAVMTTGRLYEMEKALRESANKADSLDILQELKALDEADGAVANATEYTDADSEPESDGSSVRTNGRKRK